MLNDMSEGIENFEEELKKHLEQETEDFYDGDINAGKISMKEFHLRAYRKLHTLEKIGTELPYAPDWIKEIDLFNEKQWLAWQFKHRYVLANKKPLCKCGSRSSWYPSFIECGVGTSIKGGVCVECLGWIPSSELEYFHVTPSSNLDRWLLLDSKMVEEVEKLFHVPDEITEGNKHLSLRDLHLDIERLLGKSMWEKLRIYWYLKQDGICPECNVFFDNLGFMQLHHKQEKMYGGYEFYDNLVMLCTHCHRLNWNRPEHKSSSFLFS